MFAILVTTLLVIGFVHGSREYGNATGFTLCTYDSISLAKCEALLTAADQAGIDLYLDCIERVNRDECLETVKTKHNHIVVLDEHGYMAARKSNLRPVLFARESNDVFYIAVASKNITLIDYNDAPVLVNINDENALHSAFAFNAMRGRNSCSEIIPITTIIEPIKILNSVEYKSKIDSDDILICLFGKYAQTDMMTNCNLNIGLQNAIFISQSVKFKQIKQLGKIFTNIIRNFNGGKFNFFDTFNGKNDVIFKNKSIGFDYKPTYVNGVDERTFNSFHCDHTIEKAIELAKIKCKKSICIFR